MKSFVACAGLAALAMATAVPTRVGAQSFVLDPSSASLPIVPATSADILNWGAPPAPGPLPPPVVGYSSPDLHLLPGDVIDALMYGDDGGPGSTVYFTVSRGSVGTPGGPTPTVRTEVTGVPPLTQPDASSDIFSTLDPTCGIGPGFHTQTLDGNGGPPLAPLTCYGGRGIGLSELNPTPPPPFNDQIADFDWSAAGRARFFCAYISLAPGSPSLAGGNPAMPLGAGPGDILVSCPGTPGFLGVAIPAASNGLIAGPAGCAPPVCDDIDAMSGFANAIFSLAPGSPTLTLLAASGADVFSMFSGPPGPPPIAFPAGFLGLSPGDDVKGLEQVTNGCPIPPGADPDGDGWNNACGTPDNCPGTFNPGQEDTDGDGVGDACDPCTDTDADGFGNAGFPANLCPTPDLCPFTPGPNGDLDGDGVGDVCDNCPATPNADQANYDGDGFGDVCDTCTDADGDGVGDAGFPFNTCTSGDNCPFSPNPGQADGDADGVGDVCDNCVAVVNPSQTDTDFDSFGDACDNCPIDNNFGQADGDGDMIGDACDICTGGFSMTKAQVKIGKLLTGPGTHQLQAQGNISFPGLTLPIPPLDVINPAKGMRIQLVDIGNGSSVLFDYVVPGGPVPTVCGPKDGWKTNPGLTAQKYLNKTNMNQNAACGAGTALGIGGAQAKDKTAKLKGAQFQVKGKNGTYGPVTGPLRLTMVLGGAGESAGGQCGHFTFPAPNCTFSGGGKTLKCKQ